MDKNITVDDMFRVKLPVTIFGKRYTLRVLSARDIQARDEYSILAMARRRKALTTPGTDEYLAYVQNIGTETDEVLRAAVLAVEADDLVSQVNDAIKPRYIPLPENATEEEKTDVLQQRQDETTRVMKERAAQLKAKVEARKVELEKLPRADLEQLTRKSQVDAHGHAALTRAFINYTLYAAVFTDEACRVRAFAHPEDVEDLPDVIRNDFSNRYFQELDKVTPEDVRYFFSMGDSKAISLPVKDSAATDENLETTRPAA